MLGQVHTTHYMEHFRAYQLVHDVYTQLIIVSMVQMYILMFATVVLFSREPNARRLWRQCMLTITLVAMYLAMDCFPWIIYGFEICFFFIW